MSELPHRAQVAGLMEMGDITLRGKEYTGEYLATLVAVNPGLPVQESARSPQLIYELGRLVAAAAYEAEMAEVWYRSWREATILELTHDLAVVKTITPEATKVMSKTAAEGAVRTLPQYLQHQERRLKAQETHGVFHAAYEAAKARRNSIYSYEHRQGGHTATPDDDDPVEYDNPPISYHATTRAEIAELESRMPEAPTIPSKPIPVGPPPTTVSAPVPPAPTKRSA